MKLVFSAVLAVFLLVACVSAPVQTGSELFPAGVPAEELAPAGQSAELAPVAPQKQSVTLPLVAKETLLYADGQVDRIVHYTYDRALRLVERVTTQASRIEPLETVAFEYRNGLLSSRQVRDGSGLLVSLTRFEYDSQGRLIREELLDDKQQLQTRYEYAWNPDGLRAEWRVFNAAGVLQARSEYLYDAGKALVGVRLFNGAGILMEQSEYSYQSEGKVDSIVYKTPQGTAVRRLVYVYQNGNPVEEILYRSVNRLERKQLSVFGEHGEELSRAVHDAGGTLSERVVFEYEYHQVLR